MKLIYAWIREPKNNLFKGMTKHCALFTLECENPEACDLYVKENSCINCGAFSGCKFGRKRETQGPTNKARTYYNTIRKWEEQYKEYFRKLNSLTAYNRIFKTNGYFYLPYAHMSKDIIGSHYPLESKWVAEADMTTELLDRICNAYPQAMMGGTIPSYQKESVPKFIADLKMFYPEIFERLSDKQKQRIETISYIGRSADITTCPPCDFIISDKVWKWDGKQLIGNDMLFAPVKGDIEIRITPKPGEKVKITNNNQINETTRFLD